MKHQFLFHRVVFFVIIFTVFAAINIQAQEPVYLIVGYDGMKFGATFEQLKKQIALLQGISKKTSKPYYRYKEIRPILKKSSG
jgi:hypothetical protein